MTTESPESTFRERRSAYIEGDEEKRAHDAGAAVPEAAPEVRPPAEPAAAEDHPGAAAPAEPADAPVEDAELDDMARLDLPEPSFHEIVYEYAIRAQQFLGDQPLTRDGQRRVLPNYAKHMIDLLGILEERTRGNLTPEEAQLLEQVLADLRVRYLSVTS